MLKFKQHFQPNCTFSLTHYTPQTLKNSIKDPPQSSTVSLVIQRQPPLPKKKPHVRFAVWCSLAWLPIAKMPLHWKKLFNVVSLHINTIFFFLRQRLSLNLALATLVKLTGQQTSKIHLSSTPQCWNYRPILGLHNHRASALPHPQPSPGRICFYGSYLAWSRNLSLVCFSV